MATTRATVARRPAVNVLAAPVVAVAAAAGGVKAIVPPVVTGDAVEDDDLCDCGHSSMRHPGGGVSRFPGNGCVGFKPR